MKNNLKLVLSIGALYSICAFCWLTAANANIPVGKEIIFILYIAFLTLLIPRAKSPIAWLIISFFIGLLCETSTWILAAWRFHGLMQGLEYSFETFFTGTLFFFVLHLVYGSIVWIVYKKFFTSY